MSIRSRNRLRAAAGAALGTLTRRKPRARPDNPQKILVLHELLLGDTLMLAPLLAQLRRRYPAASLLVTVKPEYAVLFAGRPYGAQALPFSERLPRAARQLAAARGADLAILPGENRFALLARALRARWVVGLAGSRRRLSDRAVDELVDLPSTPLSLAGIFASLAGASGDIHYRAGDWPAPPCAPFERPASRYAVLHVGAGSPLRLWQPDKWRSLAGELAGRGMQVVWSAGPGEATLVHAIDPGGRYGALIGPLDLAQLWHLIAGAKLLVALDSGVSHLAKLVGTPTVVLYGPGSAQLFGRGEFWRDAAFREVTVPEFPCRDQRHLFKRQVAWVRRCNRTLDECPRALCMEAISVDDVRSVIP